MFSKASANPHHDWLSNLFVFDKVTDNKWVGISNLIKHDNHGNIIIVFKIKQTLFDIQERKSISTK
jgi:hypothetical protein